MPSKFSPRKHHRRSIRLNAFNYASAGAPFITIVTHQRGYIFGEIVSDQMQLNETGKIVERAWNDLPNHYPNIELGTLVIMPNHAHGIIILTDKSTHPIKHHGLPEIVRA